MMYSLGTEFILKCDQSKHSPTMNKPCHIINMTMILIKYDNLMTQDNNFIHFNSYRPGRDKSLLSFNVQHNVKTLSFRVH